VLGEALRLGVGPAALVVTKADVNLIAGVIVAEALYGVTCPIVQVNADEMSTLGTTDPCEIDTEHEDGPTADD
jgi:predicted aconitase with swiveling domain